MQRKKSRRASGAQSGIVDAMSIVKRISDTRKKKRKTNLRMRNTGTEKSETHTSGLRKQDYTGGNKR